MKAKKSLGQNFLKSKQAIRDIIKSADLSNKDLVLEIGPGKGVLTEALLETGARVVAIEKDAELLPLLVEKFAKELTEERLLIINDDILKFAPENLLKYSKKYKIIANIPYNITGAIFEKFLSADHQPERMILMVQNEVAKRVVARDKKESILSLSVKAYGKPIYISKVPARFFSPAPKVDSAILGIFEISRKNFMHKKDEDIFFHLVRAGFAHKRKILINNLSEKIPTVSAHKLFAELSIPHNSRAENLDFDTWLKMAKML